MEKKDKKPVCGIGKLKSNERRGTASECAAKNQVREWGINSINPVVLEESKALKQGSRTLNAMSKKTLLLGRQIEKTRLEYVEELKQKPPDKAKLKRLNNKLMRMRQEVKDTKARMWELHPSEYPIGHRFDSDE